MMKRRGAKDERGGLGGAIQSLMMENGQKECKKEDQHDVNCEGKGYGNKTEEKAGHLALM